jgi:cyanophycin synthetase
MKILNIQVLKGPNYWSNYRKKLIVITLDLERFEELPTNLLNGFNDSLKILLPSLYEHCCSIGEPGGFFERLAEGTWLGHVIEHVALEIQTIAGMDCGFGRTYSTNAPGVYHVIFSYEIEQAGIYAAHAAVNIIDCLANGKKYLNLDNDLNVLKKLCASEQLGPSTGAIVKEAQKRGIPVTKFANSSLITLGYGCNQKKMWATVSSQTSNLAVDIAADKELTKNMLQSNFLPVPKGQVIQTLDELDRSIADLGFPLVIKPHNGNHGRGVLTHINTREKAIIGFTQAKQISDKVIVEHFIQGDDYRFLVVNFRLEAVAKRTPAMVTGNGIDSIQTLINKVNEDPKRGDNHEHVLTKIKIDEEMLVLLAEKEFTLNSILAKHELLYLKGTANLSSGGTASDVTHLVHPENIRLAERIARIINLDICGIDIVAESIQIPITQKSGAIIEVNAGPGLRMHLDPTHGMPRNVAEPIIDMLYPLNDFTIPVVAVTGTNGKTTVVRLIAHLARKANYSVGYSTTEGIYNNGHLIYEGDCSGPASAIAVLSDPSVEYAVLECARGGILRSGLGFDQCDISVITNVSSDHLGLKDIHTLDELARVKAVVAHSTKKNGYAILNADDDLVYELKEELSCQIALFALQDNVRIKQHFDSGGLTCYIEDGCIVIHHGKSKSFIAPLSDLPITFNGTASSMIHNVLPAILAGVISNFPLQEITQALIEFRPTAENLPGRMNVFHLNNYHVMIDYAHNEGAYSELKNYVSHLTSKRKIGIIGATGDRRPGDIQKIGAYAAEIFDEIIIRHDKDGRGSTNQQLTDFLLAGINSYSVVKNVKVISDEFEAIQYVIDHATPESFVFYSPENVFNAIDFIRSVQNKIKLRQPTDADLAI